MNDSAIAFGNQVVDVIVEIACTLRWALTLLGSREIIVCIGLNPKNAAKSAIVGGIPERSGPSCGAPAAATAADMAFGSVPLSATTTSVNRTVKPTVLPVFCSVKSIPAAELRRSGGTVPIIDDVFGEANIPKAMPITYRAPANVGYAKLYGSIDRNRKIPHKRNIPPEASPRAPFLSDIHPLTGPAETKPRLIGTM